MEELVLNLLGVEMAVGSILLLSYREWMLFLLFCLTGLGLAGIGQLHKHIRGNSQQSGGTPRVRNISRRDILYFPLLVFLGVGLTPSYLLFLGFGGFPLIEVLVSVCPFVLVLLLYMRSFEIATYFSLGAGIVLILVAIFLPVIPPSDFVDYPAIVFGIWFVTLSLISTQLDSKKKERVLLLIVLLAPIIRIFTLPPIF